MVRSWPTRRPLAPRIKAALIPVLIHRRPARWPLVARIKAARIPVLIRPRPTRRPLASRISAIRVPLRIDCGTTRWTLAARIEAAWIPVLIRSWPARRPLATRISAVRIPLRIHRRPARWTHAPRIKAALVSIWVGCWCLRPRFGSRWPRSRLGGPRLRRRRRWTRVLRRSARPLLRRFRPHNRGTGPGCLLPRRRRKLPGRLLLRPGFRCRLPWSGCLLPGRRRCLPVVLVVTGLRMVAYPQQSGHHESKQSGPQNPRINLRFHTILFFWSQSTGLAAGYGDPCSVCTLFIRESQLDFQTAQTALEPSIWKPQPSPCNRPSSYPYGKERPVTAATPGARRTKQPGIETLTCVVKNTGTHSKFRSHAPISLRPHARRGNSIHFPQPARASSHKGFPESTRSTFA